MGGKKPDKYHYQLKEIPKIESNVFDKTTLLNLAKVMKKGLVQNFDYPISTGKEAVVFKATTPTNRAVAVKIYKRAASFFLRKNQYILNDPRFEKIRWNEKNIVYAFANKEFKNLKVCERAKVWAPKPIFLEGNVLVLSFLGEKGLPYPTLIQTIAQEKFLNLIIENMKKMYKAKLVHADLSEYNIMIAKNKTPYFIDFSQGVVLNHPKAQEFLERDLNNVLNFFKKFGIIKDFETILKKIKK